MITHREQPRSIITRLNFAKIEPLSREEERDANFAFRLDKHRAAFCYINASRVDSRFPRSFSFPAVWFIEVEVCRGDVRLIFEIGWIGKSKSTTEGLYDFLNGKRVERRLLGAVTNLLDNAVPNK